MLVEFDLADLEYLGPTQSEFTRVISSRKVEGWVVDGLAVSPAPTFLEQYDPGLGITDPASAGSRGVSPEGCGPER